MFQKFVGFLVFVSAVSALAEESCQPSKWGPDDEIGNVNLITPQTVLEASKLVKTGKTYGLGITIDNQAEIRRVG